ncbi:MAG: BrnT family toxin [Deltaproteobacteria bacterium]|nr:MAG: BrnT family toxin [Deltaproteobacteria bacterium]
MDIGFLWDEDKYDLVRRTHDVSFHEVVSCFDDERVIEVDDPQGHPDRFMMVAQSAGRRVLQVVVSEQDLPLYRIITAFDAAQAWLDEYRNG